MKLHTFNLVLTLFFSERGTVKSYIFFPALSDEERLLPSRKMIVEELPECNREVLRYLLQFLQRVNELRFYVLIVIKLKRKGFLLFCKIVVLQTLLQNKTKMIPEYCFTRIYADFELIHKDVCDPIKYVR